MSSWTDEKLNETLESLKKEVAKNYGFMSKISNLEKSLLKHRQKEKNLKRQNVKSNERLRDLEKELEYANSSKEVLQKLVGDYEAEKSTSGLEVCKEVPWDLKGIASSWIE